MDKKEKIKLLADLQAALDNSSLMEIMMELPSGEKIYEIFSSAVSTELENILSGTKAVQPQADLLNKTLERSVEMASKLEKTVLMDLLKNIQQKLESRSTEATAEPQRPAPIPQPSQGQPLRKKPVLQDPPPSQEELQRAWEEQVASSPTSSPRRGGGAFGTF